MWGRRIDGLSQRSGAGPPSADIKSDRHADPRGRGQIGRHIRPAYRSSWREARDLCEDRHGLVPGRGVEKDHREAHEGEGQRGAEKGGHVPPYPGLLLNLMCLSSGTFTPSTRAEDQHGHAEKDGLMDAKHQIIESKGVPNPNDDHVEKDRADQTGLTIVS